MSADFRCQVALIEGLCQILLRVEHGAAYAGWAPCCAIYNSGVYILKITAVRWKRRRVAEAAAAAILEGGAVRRSVLKRHAGTGVTSYICLLIGVHCK